MKFFLKFFLPAADDPQLAEQTFTEMARWVNSPAPPAEERVHWVSFVHNGEEWRAEVGQPLRGVHTVQRRRATSGVDVTRPVTDPATVLAIFPGESVWHVVTNAPPLGTVTSRWDNPFLIGDPAIRDVGRFDPLL